MPLRIALSALLGWLALAGPTAAQTLASPAGNWLVQDGDGVIHFEPCRENMLCGTIVGTRATKQCHLTILNVAAADDGTWTGHITNPDNGSIWNVQVWLAGRDRMQLRGYVLVPLLGQTQTWTRYTGRLAPDCKMS